ncbi:thiaminase II [Guptibacillus hwajinpoensis]|uniref:Aminopyrimidine aminohydrolase n=1 Tax=Guptibacillus hwajinpoensis TaxID=208199 RepID=A0ABU0K280_9BACL|nr:thiaminase II [Alkalihalobacillus hemicentroti]MDQ0483466.1 thiaminase/transcriptional activator TenA [Alkalihalobacillus hemicentroti]
MLFTEKLREEAAPIFEAIYNHPFVRGLANGKLEKEQLVHYVKQDFEYLNTFVRIYGVAISKCETREEMALFNEQISFVLHSEIHPHNNLCRAAGVSYDELQGYSLAPTAHHYTRHMLDAAHTGTLGEIIAALLPCPWTYLEIGQRLMQEVNPSEDHPFYDWITFYGQESMEPVTNQLRSILDEWARTAPEKELKRIRDYFILSCQLEYGFWDMAYRVEEWPVALQKEKRI